ncbi:MAG: glutamate-5-semialdehyde dehydrogenase [Rickettsiales bacterium]|nr:glutamate-5-semialdehyde dehydrogenase [Rickettsiales bacterium]
MTEITTPLLQLTAQSKQAYRQLALSSHNARNQALRESAHAIRNSQAEIIGANETDMEAAAQKGLSLAMLERLKLDAERIEAMAKGLEAITELPDPLTGELDAWERPSGLHIKRVPVPLGVIGVIYESRPNVTADAAGLCIKSGNAVLLRGGSESFHSSAAIAKCITQGLTAAGLSEHAVQLIPSTQREWVTAMLHASGEIDVLIPRGGKGLTDLVARESRVPTILHLDGNCHSYVHVDADIAKAAKGIANAKMRRTGICGATESLLVDEAIASQVIPALCDALMEAGCTEIRGDTVAQKIDSRISAASSEDWTTEYLDSIISLKTVSGLEEAIHHINIHGSHHTDAIFTENTQATATFQASVDSAIVMHNTSTQFADGGEFGMGAEIGISTGRLHARGPVGAGQLVTYKYTVTSDGATRA